MNEKVITHVDARSPSDQAKIKAGETLVSINGNTHYDIIDYLWAGADAACVLRVRAAGNSERDVTVKNSRRRPLGLHFDAATIDAPRRCGNRCVFCFMDQMPKGLRKTLYFKDDDYRLSFLDGNYITLTNASDSDLERIIKNKLSPLNISVHTTDPQLRENLMKNPKSGEILRQLKYLAEGGIRMNLQFVLCPGYNDKDALVKSLEDIMEFENMIDSAACVPVGLTKFRDGLTPLCLFDRQGAKDVIEIVGRYACGKTRFPVCAADEFFLLAGIDFPQDSYYGNYEQYDNGVGMARSFFDDITAALASGRYADLRTEAVLATGKLAEPILMKAADQINHAAKCNLSVLAIDNKFFGSSVTAAGLICGRDLIGRLSGIAGSLVMIPDTMMKNDEDVFLDSVTLKEAQEKTAKRIIAVPSDGYGFLDALCALETKNE